MMENLITYTERMENALVKKKHSILTTGTFFTPWRLLLPDSAMPKKR